MIYNTPCVSCQLPMNGGVYRKPNQCPHCLTLQNPHKSADNKCLASAGKDEEQPAVLAEEQPQIEIQVPHKATVIAFDRHLVEVEELTDEAFSDESTPEDHQTPVIEDSAEQDNAAQDASLVSNGTDASTQSNEVQENTAASVSGKRKHFDNLEVKPDLDESLDIVLHIDGSEELIADEDTFSVDTANFLSMEHAVVAMARETHLRVSGGDSVSTAVDGTVVADDAVAEKALPPQDAASETRVDDRHAEDKNAPQASQADCIPVLTPVNNGISQIRSVKTAPEASNAGPSAQDCAVDESAATLSDNDDYENVVLTTESAHVVGVEQHIDLVTAECVVGMDRVKQDLNKTQDFSRKEYGASPSVLKEARKTVLDEIKKEAFLRGADTVVDVQLDYNEISRGDAPMMMVVATGTAVKAHVKEVVGA